MKYKYCLTRRDSTVHRTIEPMRVQNVYFYTIGDLKTYIAEDLYTVAKTTYKHLKPVDLCDKLRDYAKYVVLDGTFCKPQNKYSYLHLYKEKQKYYGVHIAQDSAYILGEVDITKVNCFFVDINGIWTAEFNLLEQELIAYVVQTINAIAFGAFDVKLQLHYTYRPEKKNEIFRQYWCYPSTNKSHCIHNYCGWGKHQYVREKAYFYDTELEEYVNSRERKRRRAMYTHNAGNVSLGWKKQFKCRKAWAKHMENPQYEKATRSLYDEYMHEWLYNEEEDKNG